MLSLKIKIILSFLKNGFRFRFYSKKINLFFIKKIKINLTKYKIYKKILYLLCYSEMYHRVFRDKPNKYVCWVNFIYIEINVHVFLFLFVVFLF